MATAKIDIQKFLTDPAHAEEKEFMWSAFDAFLAERDAKVKAKADEDAAALAASGHGKTFLQNIFDGK